MDHSTLKWLLSIELGKDEKAGFTNPQVWIRAMDRIAKEFFSDERERLECVVFVVNAFCGYGPSSFKQIYLHELNRLAGERVIASRGKNEVMRLAFQQLVSATEIRLMERSLSGRRTLEDDSPSDHMSPFLKGLRRRLGASPKPMPVMVR